MRRTLKTAGWATVAAACAAAALWWVGPQREFKISGTITLAGSLRYKSAQVNSVLFVIAKNRGQVPVAVCRIINPHFPQSFSLQSSDLIVPGSRPAGPLTLHVQMNAHGQAGATVPGDLEGSSGDAVRPGQDGIHIVIDREA